MLAGFVGAEFMSREGKGDREERVRGGLEGEGREGGCLGEVSLSDKQKVDDR